MENKIKEEELKTVKEQQDKIAKILGELGFLETQKHALLHEIADLNEKTNDFKKELEKSYGQIEINLENGSYSKLKKEEEVLQDV